MVLEALSREFRTGSRWELLLCWWHCHLGWPPQRATPKHEDMKKAQRLTIQRNVMTREPSIWKNQTHKTPCRHLLCVAKTVRIYVWKMWRKQEYVCMCSYKVLRNLSKKQHGHFAFTLQWGWRSHYEGGPVGHGWFVSDISRQLSPPSHVCIHCQSNRYSLIASQMLDLYPWKHLVIGMFVDVR